MCVSPEFEIDLLHVLFVCLFVLVFFGNIFPMLIKGGKVAIFFLIQMTSKKNVYFSRGVMKGD